MADSSRDRITQRLALEGAQDILKQLAQLGEAGEKAFKQLEDATNAVNGNLGNVSSGFARLRATFQTVSQAVAPIQQGFGDLRDRIRDFGTSLAETADKVIPHFREIAVLATGGAIAGFAALVKSAADAAAQVGITAQRLGLSISDFQNFSNAAHTAGVESNTFGSAILQLSSKIQQAGNEQTTALDQLILKLYGATTQTGVQIVGQAQKTQGRIISVANDSVNEITKLAQTMQTKLSQQGINKPLQQIINDLQQGREAAGDMGEAIRNLLRQSGVTSKSQTLGEALGIDQINQQMNALTKLGINVLDPFTGKLRDTRAILLELADAFEKLPDGPQKTATALQIFSQDGDRLISFLDKGSGGIKALAAQFESLGINIDKNGVAAGLRFRASLISLEALVSGVKTLVGLAFAPAASQLINALTEALFANAKSLITWAQTEAQQFQPVVDDFVRLIGNIGKATGEQQPLQTDFVKGFVSTLQAAQDAVKVLIGAFRQLSNAIDLVLIPINALFGTQLTGNVVLVTGLILSFTGVFSLLGSAIAVVGSAIGLMVAGLVSLGVSVPALGVIIAASIGLLVAYAANWKLVTGTVGAFWEMIKAVAGYLTTELVEAVTSIGDTFKNAWDVAVYWTNYAIGLIQQSIDKIKAAIASVFGGGSQDAAAPISPVQLAGGGPVAGPGGPTSDSILARLSNGEFVMRAAAVRALGVDFLGRRNAHGAQAMASYHGAFKGFADGGLINALEFPQQNTSPLLASVVPATGSGGGGAEAHFHFPDGGHVVLPTQRSSLEQLQKAATKSKLLSTGRMPGYYGS